MSHKVFLQYPCGKLFELKFPITITATDGKLFSVLPGMEEYFFHAKKKFEINNLKVVEKEIQDEASHKSPSFISLTKKIRCVE